MTATAARGKFPYRAHRTLKQVFYDEWMVQYRRFYLIQDVADIKRLESRARSRASRAMRP